MLGSDPINLHFHIPATDHLGREEVQGQLHFQADHIDLHWRLKGNVFTGGAGEMSHITIPYPSVAEVTMKQRWFRPIELIIRLDQPELVTDIPGVEVGRMTLLIDAQSKEAVKKVHNLIDYRRSLFQLDETNKRLDAMRD